MFSVSAITVATLLFSSQAHAATYAITDNYVGQSLLDAFIYDAIPDPTNGRVVYVDQTTAVAQNLTYASDDSVIIRSDSTTILDPAGAGRNSIRLKSSKVYTNGATVFNIRHMPEGCGTWPAVWSFGETDGAQWPALGEIDILEGVNNQPNDQVALHTATGCTVPETRDQTGTTLMTDCDANIVGNPGCGVESASAVSFGPGFNSNGGGWYAVERTADFIKVWFWARNDAAVPSGVAEGSDSVTTDNWGTPTAYFPGDTCNMEKFFGAHNFIINLTFCGAWAGADDVYSAAGCPSTCVDYVNNNPADFANAYFDFAWIKHYD
ncbi:glycoside hydrolase family 16 protein [Cylindrobasidium torrendii FP15055 ss-10]|uniref:Glycoside hydrolase family 16 protein n=1 Tax=Cylindrobasidium torrendii FP15055 ss-10 TaxID=1314674 RepID=A0A0D7BCA5_9AGAR|nr:glycoside hydrolase family 16 protein [Cylindrobasidium torrendii FP15055 ss-10]